MALLPLHQGRQQRATAQAPHTGTPGKQPRRQAQASAFLVPPWQPAQLPGDEEGDGEEDDATEGDDDGQQTDGDLCGKERFLVNDTKSPGIPGRLSNLSGMKDGVRGAGQRRTDCDSSVR